VPESHGIIGARSDWLKPNLVWAVAGAVGGWFFGRYVGDLIAGNWTVSQDTTMNNVSVVFAMSFGVLGWIAGIGGLTYPFFEDAWPRARPVLPSRSWVRYFRMTEDHKVVGLQYLVGVLVFLFTGGLLAMAIRTELLSPTSHVFGPGTYIAIVSEHGTMMMMMASSAVVGPLGNWLVPLMIGSRRMAFSSYRGLLVLDLHGRVPGHHDGFAPGRFPDWLDGLRATADPSEPRHGRLSRGLAVIGIGMIAAGFNLAATIINYRARG